MSQFSGPQGKGAMKRRREQKRLEAVARNGDASAKKLLKNIFGEAHTDQEREDAYNKVLDDSVGNALKASKGM
jgi:hypothetical protein